MNCLQEKLKKFDQDTHQLMQCNLQIRSLKRESETKDDMIEKIASEKEHTQILANQVNPPLHVHACLGTGSAVNYCCYVSYCRALHYRGPS